MWWKAGSYNVFSPFQVNHSPSFTTDARLDREVKDALLCDALNLINLRACDKRKVLEEDKRRVKERLLQAHQPPREARYSGGHKCIYLSIDPTAILSHCKPPTARHSLWRPSPPSIFAVCLSCSVSRLGETLHPLQENKFLDHWRRQGRAVCGQGSEVKGSPQGVKGGV